MLTGIPAFLERMGSIQAVYMVEHCAIGRSHADHGVLAPAFKIVDRLAQMKRFE
jgi:hypothetical protein